MKRIAIFLGLIISSNLIAQETPKLVVGIVVDQMRYDYLNLYWDQYGEGGFKRLINEGYNCKNTHYNYVPTYTGPGHASIYTGTTPATHGIVGNSWYDKNTGSTVYCVDDASANTVGSTSIHGKKSSHQNLTTTITDELRLFNKNSKVISISLKDRGAVLPGGHNPSGCYWYDSETGFWISSSAYTNVLPRWVGAYNGQGKAKEYLSQQWTTLLSKDKYLVSAQDMNHYEGALDGEEKPVFPHDLKTIFETNKDWSLIKYTPFGNTLTREFAEAAISSEQLGKDNDPDILAVSFSATDYVGHRFGPQSIEHQDTYLRLDQDIAHLLSTLDTQVGKGNYVVFLTADHGAVRVPQLLIDNKIPAGYFGERALQAQANAYLSKLHGEGEWVKSFSNFQFFLNTDLIMERKIELDDTEEELIRFAMTLDGVANAYTSEQLLAGNGGKFLSLMQMGYNQQRSGNVAIALEPGWVSYDRVGTTHGSPYTYDTHVPMLWYGKGIEKGSTAREMYITDIASTVATILNISYPNGNIGTPILEIVD